MPLSAASYMPSRPERVADNESRTADNDQGYKSAADLRAQYEDFIGNKNAEIQEARLARRYYHASQWSSKNLEVLKKRGQDPITYNRTARKIDGIVGLLARMRQDPKAYPRTPQHEQGADLATGALRYQFDIVRWDRMQTSCGRQCAVDGLVAAEIVIEKDSKGLNQIKLNPVPQDLFFYDPRSFDYDFSDAEFMGTAKWVALDRAKLMFPESADDLEQLISARFMSELGPDHEREVKWTNVKEKRVRIVDHWYFHEGGWCYAIYCSDVILREGKSYLTDDMGQTICRYLAFSCAVDQDGDRYGFPRNLKGPQDEINQRRSRALWQSASRRIILRKGTVSQVEDVRREANRADGVIEWEQEKPEFDDVAKQADLRAQLEFLQEAKNEIENFGPNPALIGQGVENKSGRAIALLQQAGIAELGPFLEAWRDWKLRIYRAVWCAMQRYWDGERWIRITDNEGLAQFVKINRMAVDPQSGQPIIVNALGQLDVDIIIDESEDTVNMMADFYETLKQVIPPVAPMLTPPQAQAVVGLLIENAPIGADAKKKFRDASEQQPPPDPAAEQAKQLALAGEAAKVKETESKALLNMTKARKEGMPEAPGMAPRQEPEVPLEIQTAQALADIEDTQAATDQKRAQTAKLAAEAAMAPMKFMHDAHNAAADRAMRAEQFGNRQP